MTGMRLTPAPGPIAGPSDSTASESADNAQIAGSVAKTISGTIAGTVAGPNEQIVDLFEIAGSEVDAIQKLDEGVASLHEVQLAKALLWQVRPAKIRAALELRGAALRGASA